MIWIVGASGMLGRELSAVLTDKNLPFVGTDRDVDFRNADAVAAFAQGKGVEWVVNCAAYTAVDKAEDEPELAKALNVDGPAVLAHWCSANKAKLIHISTDYVFSGDGNTPYTEDDPIAPTGVYGVTKADGETAVRQALKEHIILRTAWLYGQYGPNFVATMLRLMREKPEFGVVNDQWGAPTWAWDLSQVIAQLIESKASVWGTFHASGEGQVTWHGFAAEIYTQAKALGLVETMPVIKPLTTAQYPTKAQRPAWSVLSKAKLKAVYGLTFPDWKDSLARYMRIIKG